MWKDLEPGIVRQRLIIEGHTDHKITDSEIRRYLRELGKVCEMVVLMDPITHPSEKYGWAGWVHWETSGAHFYAWDKTPSFFSVDIYTCKQFDVTKAVEFTREYFSCKDTVWKEV